MPMNIFLIGLKFKSCIVSSPTMWPQMVRILATEPDSWDGHFYPVTEGCALVRHIRDDSDSNQYK